MRVSPPWLCLACQLLLGCTTQERAHPERAELDALFEAPPALGPPCTEAGPAHIGGDLELHLFVSRAVPSAQAERVLASLPAYYTAHGLRLSLGEVVQLDAAALLVRGQPRQALTPLRRFLHTHAVPPRTGVNMVVLERIATKDAQLAHHFESLEGLALAPALRESRDALYRELALPARFTPTVLIGVREALARARGGPSLTAAHELGHVLGLPHAEGADLMSTEPPECVPSLTPEQVAIARKALGR